MFSSQALGLIAGRPSRFQVQVQGRASSAESQMLKLSGGLVGGAAVTPDGATMPGRLALRTFLTNRTFLGEASTMTTIAIQPSLWWLPFPVTFSGLRASTGSGIAAGSADRVELTWRGRGGTGCPG